jgi:DNA-nicking Smr family endonuclease
VKPASLAPPAPESLEPGRRRRIERGRDAPAGVIDLHGLNQDEAREALTRFVTRGFAERRRTLLVITGKGALGDGILRRRVPEWLGQAPLRAMIAGLSEAHRRHGGAGALYVALRRC